MTARTGALRLDSHLAEGDRRAELARDVRAGLTAPLRSLPPKWFYDEGGSRLFDVITRLPEYYPTRAECQVLQARAAQVAALTAADTLVELGSGTSDKTRLLLDALAAAGTLRRFVHLLPGDGRRLVAFLGGTIGNLLPAGRARLLRVLAGEMGPDDALLLGTDLVKDPDRLVAAYDDGAGVTAAFNRNVLHVLRRELDAEVDPDAFDHVAVWDAEHEWIEMRLWSRRDQVVRVLDLEVAFAAGQDLRTEISAKSRPDGIARELVAAGLTPQRCWTDPAGDYAVTLARPARGR